MVTGKFVRLTLLLCALLVCFHSSAAQQATPAPQAGPEPNKRAAIADLLVVMDMKKNTSALFNSIIEADEKQVPELAWESVSSMKEVQALTAAERADLKQKLVAESARMNKRVRELFTEKIDFPRLIEEISYNLYDKYFTESEIRDLAAFYKSPTGRKSIEVMPNLFSESLANAVTVMRPKIGEIMAQLMDEEVNRARTEVESMKAQKKTTPPPKRRTTGRRH